MKTAQELLDAGYTEVTGCDLRKLVQDVYDLSRPQGMGMLHFTPGPLPEADVNQCLQHGRPLHLDYVKDRACKFSIFRPTEEPDRWFIGPSWYDHTPEDLAELIRRTLEK